MYLITDKLLLLKNGLQHSTFLTKRDFYLTQIKNTDINDENMNLSDTDLYDSYCQCP